MSFLGNWCVKPETPITACSKQMLGKGPMQDFTTQKHDYTWKHIPVETSIRPEDNLVSANLPMERKLFQFVSINRRLFMQLFFHKYVRTSLIIVTQCNLLCMYLGTPSYKANDLTPERDLIWLANYYRTAILHD